MLVSLGFVRQGDVAWDVGRCALPCLCERYTKTRYSWWKGVGSGDGGQCEKCLFARDSMFLAKRGLEVASRQ